MKHIQSIVLFCAAPFMTFAANPSAATTPYTFLGRVMDSAHVAFDGDRAATVEVSDSTRRLLAKSTTFFRADSRRNYVLPVPLATASANGYAVQGAELVIDVTDDVGKVWSGVVVDPVAGVSGGVREVDIVLGEDLDGDGIDDALYRRLRLEWEWSEYYRDGEAFDPSKDYDGDGVSTIAEAFSGTNPFNPQDVLRITEFSHKGGVGTRSSATQPTSLSFDSIGGHAYMVEMATDLVKQDWTPCTFIVSGSDVPVNVFSFPADAGGATSTVYLLPSNSTNAFYRVKAE